MYNNLVSGNDVAGHLAPALPIHTHLLGTHQDLNGNVIIGNNFGTNNTKNEEPDDLQTTGVFIGSEDHLDITLFLNDIHDDYYGVFTTSPNGVTVNGLAFNAYVHDTVRGSPRTPTAGRRRHRTSERCSHWAVPVDRRRPGNRTARLRGGSES